MKTFAEWIVEKHPLDEGVWDWVKNPFKVGGLAAKYPQYAGMLSDADTATKAALDQLLQMKRGQEQQTLDGLQRVIQGRQMNLAQAVQQALEVAKQPWMAKYQQWQQPQG